MSQTVNVRVVIKAILQNPTGMYDDETVICVPVEIVDDPKFREGACAQIIMAQVQKGALIRKIDDNTVEAIPMCRVLNIQAQMDVVSRIGLAL